SEFIRRAANEALERHLNLKPKKKFEKLDEDELFAKFIKLREKGLSLKDIYLKLFKYGLSFEQTIKFEEQYRTFLFEDDFLYLHPTIEEEVRKGKTIIEAANHAIFTLQQENMKLKEENRTIKQENVELKSINQNLKRKLQTLEIQNQGLYQKLQNTSRELQASTCEKNELKQKNEVLETYALKYLGLKERINEIVTEIYNIVYEYSEKIKVEVDPLKTQTELLKHLSLLIKKCQEFNELKDYLKGCLKILEIQIYKTVIQYVTR
ncbi:hypothetical protein CW703_02085, partial [Candidatus Bathyarchaeota archaeon]